MSKIDHIGYRTVQAGLALTLLIGCAINVSLLLRHLRSSPAPQIFTGLITPSLVVKTPMKQGEYLEGRLENTRPDRATFVVIQVAANQ